MSKRPNISVQRMTAGGAGSHIRTPVVRRHRSPRRWTNGMIGYPRINICVLLAAMSLVVGCAKPIFEQPRLSVGQTVPPSLQAGPQANRVSIGDTVVVSLEGTPVPVPPFTNQVASDGTVTIWNSLHFKAAGLTTDELASQIRWALVTNWG